MIKKIILPVFLAAIGTGGGIGAGIFLKPPAVEEGLSDDGTETDANEAIMSNSEQADSDEDAVFEYVRMNNQFIVPVVDDGAVRSMVVMSLSIEVTPGQQTLVFQLEPKLRDAFLQVLFDHANIGGFAGAFTSNSNMKTLRTALRETAQRHLGAVVNDVLITDILRQDV